MDESPFGYVSCGCYEREMVYHSKLRRCLHRTGYAERTNASILPNGFQEGVNLAPFCAVATLEGAFGTPGRVFLCFFRRLETQPRRCFMFLHQQPPGGPRTTGYLVWFRVSGQ